MELEEIKKTVKEIVLEIGGNNGNGQMTDIDCDQSLIDSGFLDSLGAIQIIEAFSEKFDVIFYPAELSLDNFDNINNIARFILAKLNGEEA